MSFQFLQNLDFISFLSGFITALVLSWLLRRIMPTFRAARQRSRDKRLASRSSQRLAVEYSYRNDFIRHIQGKHLASSLFSMDEILIPPFVLAPPPQTLPGDENYLPGTLSKILPYMPEYPEFASVFGAEKITLVDGLKGGANLLLLGAAGAGKTVALSHLGSLIASFSAEVGDFSNFIPIYIHAAELQLPLPEDEDPFNAIFYSLSNTEYLSRKTRARLSNLIQIALNEERALLLIDGADEISPIQIELLRDLIQALKLEHPSLRMIVTASSEFADGLSGLGLHPVTLAGWTIAERKAFTRRWSSLWAEHIEEGIWQNTASGVEQQMLVNWLDRDTIALTPLELTLRTWAAFAGDGSGPRNQDSMDAFVRRAVSNFTASATALERVGMQMALNKQPVIHHRAATLWSRGQMVNADDIDALSEKIQELSDEDDTTPGRVGRSTVSALIEAGILVNRGNERVSFVNPVLAGYFAGRGFANFGRSGALAQQAPWSLRDLALHYLAGQTEIEPILETLDQDDIAHVDLFAAGRWLRDMDAKSSGRMMLMRRLVTIFQNESRPAALRQRAIAALAISSDRGIGALSKKLMASDDPLTRSMCVLALGYQRNEKYIQDLMDAASDTSFVVRAAACFALANYGDKKTLETVATALLHGDEDTQRAAAEALAIDPEEGLAYLVEATKEEDLLVRRSAIFGLAKTRRADARELIVKLQLEDDQWVVRNAATQEMLQFERGSASIPAPFDPLHQTGWLVAYAAESGEGLAPGRAANDMLFRAMMKGTTEQRIAAMDRYRLSGSSTVLTALYEILKQPHPTELLNAVVETLWHLRAQGITTHQR